MKLLQIKCPSCGANLKPKENTKEITCNYCGTTTVIDDEIIKVEHHIKNDMLELKFENASTYLNKMKNYNMAFKQYKELSDIISSDPRVWLGQLLSLTKNFSNYDIYNDSKLLEYIREVYQNYLNVEEDKTKQEKIKKEYNDYIEIVNKNIEKNTENKYNYLSVVLVIIIIITIIIFMINYIN